MTTVGISDVKVVDRHRTDLGDIAALAESMREVGQLQPVVVTPEFRLVAGERRLAAARELGWDRVRVNVVDNLTDARALLRAEQDENVCRKDFTPTEAESIATAREELLRPLAEAAMKNGKAEPCANFAQGSAPQPANRKTRKIAASGTGYSHETLRKVREVKEIASDEDAPAEVREAARDALIEMSRTGKVNGPHKRVKQVLARVPVVAAPAQNVGERTFATIVADPPWRYGNTSTRGAAEDHYGTMSIDELCQLDVARNCGADKAHLYLWTTAGHLPEAFRVMDAWGFTYKTYLVWVKPQMGMGNYFRVSTELVLFGVKGGLGTNSNALVNHFTARRGRHFSEAAGVPRPREAGQSRPLPGDVRALPPRRGARRLRMLALRGRVGSLGEPDMTGYRSSHFRHECGAKGCYIEQLPSWDDLIECFPRSIRPTDVDGMVEMNGHFLFLEEKGRGKSLDHGQSLALRRLSKVPDVTAVVFRPPAAAKAAVTDLECLVYDGFDPQGFQPRGRVGFKRWLCEWAEGAERAEGHWI